MIVLENLLGFLFVPPRLKLFLSVLFLRHQILSPKTLQLSYSILVAFFNKNRVSSDDVSQRCVTWGVPKICLVDFLMEFTRTYKNHIN